MQRAQAATTTGARGARTRRPQRAQQRAQAATTAGARERAQGGRSARCSARMQRRWRARVERAQGAAARNAARARSDGGGRA
eukprot:2508440-Pleurochrysis_carterae.AAC.1